MQSSPSLPCRASIRSGGESLKQEVSRRSRNSGSDSFHSVRLGKGFLTGKISEDTKFDKTDFRNIVPRFTPENRKANQAVVDLLGKIATQRRRHPRRSHSPGCWRRSPGSFRSPAQRNCIAWKKTLEPLPSNLRPTISAKSKAPPRRLRSRVPAIRKSCRNW